MCCLEHTEHITGVLRLKGAEALPGWLDLLESRGYYAWELGKVTSTIALQNQLN